MASCCSLLPMANNNETPETTASSVPASERVNRDAATIIGFSNQAIGIPFAVERDSEFDRVVLVSQVVNIPMQVIVLSYQSEVSYTVMDLLSADVNTYYTVREALDAIEDMRTKFEQE